MKIRHGFVSNSSSSSFIVGGPIVDGKVTMMFNPKHTSTILNEDQLVQYMNDYYGECEWDDEYQVVISARKAFASGRGVVVLSVEYGGEELFDQLDTKYNTVDSEC